MFFAMIVFFSVCLGFHLFNNVGPWKEVQESGPMVFGIKCL